MSHFSILVEEIAAYLKKAKWQLVTAESCTGGLIAACLTEIPGSSNWFERGFVTYSNLAKEEMLSVAHELIQTHGAVSEEVALAMAAGALQHSMGNIAVSVTGIAGPEGGSIEKPVGTVCFAWEVHHQFQQTSRQQFTGSRQEIRLSACQYALNGVLSTLKKVCG
ncbi:TPA: CinA family protein [Legionella pneumophila]|nr:CinA family protein [Legionella pneumophila]